MFLRGFRWLERNDGNHMCSKYIVARLAFLTASPRAKFRRSLSGGVEARNIEPVAGFHRHHKNNR